MLTLAIGDLFIPERAVDLPAKFRKLLAPNPNSTPTNSKISQVLCLGNITSSPETLEFLYRLSPNFHLVKGEYDDTEILEQHLKNLGEKNPVIPAYKVVTHDNLRIGFTSGHQIVPKHDDMSLSNLARELDVDILIWGGALQKSEAYAVEGKFFVNPGSATGSSGWDTEEPEGEPEEREDIDPELWQKIEEMAKVTPSFCLMDTHGSTCVLYIYTYIDGEVKVDKVMYKKE